MASALGFAARCHLGQRRTSDGAAFLEHPVEVAALLHDAGCSSTVVAAGLLHDVLEDTPVSASELELRFGAGVARLVQAVSDEGSIRSYRRRKRLLREQVSRSGRDAALLFAADKISKLRELPDRTRPEHAMRLEHYNESLTMLQRVAADHPLVQRLASELQSHALRCEPQGPAGVRPGMTCERHDLARAGAQPGANGCDAELRLLATARRDHGRVPVAVDHRPAEASRAST